MTTKEEINSQSKEAQELLERVKRLEGMASSKYVIKREQIREGIHKGLQGDMPTVVGEPCPYCRDTEKVLNYLDSQGVVLKVEGELLFQVVINETVPLIGTKVHIPQEVLKSAGYTAWEPLIEEVKV